MDQHSKYTEYMKRTFPQGAFDQQNKCFQFSKKMNKDFPELIMKRGYVYSHENIDNHHPRYPKQYSHYWLQTKAGVIVDPTINQFRMLGELHYVDVGKETYQGPCIECRQLCFGENPKYGEAGLVCGQCEWS